MFCGATHAEVLARCPQLTAEGLSAAFLFAAANLEPAHSGPRPRYRRAAVCRHVTSSTLPAATRRHSRYATSSSARGFFAATISSVRAAPEGARRPCSQS